MKAELWRQESSNGPFLRAKLYTIYTDEEGEWHDSTWFNTGTKDPAKKSDVENLGAAMGVEKVTRERAIGEDDTREAA